MKALFVQYSELSCYRNIKMINHENHLQLWLVFAQENQHPRFGMHEMFNVKKAACNVG